MTSGGWNRGKSDFGESWRAKSAAGSSATHKGKPKSPEHRAKIAAALKDKRLDESTKKKISESRQGIAPWNAGKRLVNSPECAESLRKCGKKGPEHWNWKGGISEENNRVRNSVEYRAWRDEVFKRDSYRCVECGESGYVEANHKKPFSTHPELRLCVENGETLCKKHHREKTNAQRRKNQRRTPDDSSAPQK